MARLRVNSRCALGFYFQFSKRSRLCLNRHPRKSLKICVELIGQFERSNTPASQFCQSIYCSLKSFTQPKCKLAAKSQTRVFLHVQTSEPTKDSIEIKLREGISIVVPVSTIEFIAATFEQLP
jgi:hypothetical protein